MIGLLATKVLFFEIGSKKRLSKSDGDKKIFPHKNEG